MSARLAPRHRRHPASVATRALAAVAALAFSATAATAACVIFDERDFAGPSRTIDNNTALADLGRWDDRASSVQLSDGCSLISYDERDFDGDRRTFRESTRWVENYWANRISSAQCSCPDADRAASGRFDENRSVPLRRITEAPRVTTLDEPALGARDERLEPEERFDDRRERMARRAAQAEDGDRPRSGGFDEPQAEAAPRRTVDLPTDQCALYADRDFGGARLRLDKNFQFTDLSVLDRAVSSMVVPEGCALRVFTRTEVDGPRRSFGPGTYRELARGWDDVIRSAQCLCGPGAAEEAAAESDESGRADADRGGRDERSSRMAALDGARESFEDPRDDDDEARRPVDRFEDRFGDDVSPARRDSRDDDQRQDDGDRRAEDFARTDDREAPRADADDRRRSAALDASGPLREGCSIHEFRNFRGQSLMVPANRGFESLGPLAGRVTSLRVADGCTIEIFANEGFNRTADGFRMTFDRDERRLGPDQDNRVGSVACRCESR